MNRSLRSTLLGTVAGSGLILLGCTSSPPQAPPVGTQPELPYQATQVGAYQARDYYFPPSASMRAVYSFNETTEVATDTIRVAGRLTVDVVSYSATQAVIRSTVTVTPQEGEPATETSTSSVTVQPDGSVVASDGGTLRHSNAVFTAAGDLVAPASGSEIPAVRAHLVGTETVTVPAGTYQTVHLQEGPQAQGVTPTDVWLARGVGIVRQRLDATFPLPPMEGQGQAQQQAQQGHTTYEMRLESFTP